MQTCSQCNKLKVCIIGNFWICKTCDKTRVGPKCIVDEFKFREEQLIPEDPLRITWDPYWTPYSAAAPSTSWVHVVGLDNRAIADLDIPDDWESRYLFTNNLSFALTPQIDMEIIQADIKPTGCIGMRWPAGQTFTLIAPPHIIWIKRA